MKLTAPQERVLRRIIKTGGGGVFAECDPDLRVIMRLHKLGLCQGKRGDPARAVHTSEGLNMIRELDTGAAP